MLRVTIACVAALAMGCGDGSSAPGTRDASIENDAAFTFDAGRAPIDGGVIEADLRLLRGAQTLGSVLDLGDVVVGTSGPVVEIQIFNASGTPFELTRVEIESGAFVLTPPTAQTIPVQGSVPFSISFAPTAEGELRATINVFDAGEVARSITAFGRGIAETPGEPGLFVAVGYAGRRIVSADGINWLNNIVEAGPGGDDDQQFRGVGYGDGRFVAVGGAALGRIMYSSSGALWTEVSDQRNFLGDVAFGNGLYVAVGSNGRHLRSTDANTWTDVGIERGAHYRSIGFGGGRFVAIGDSGRRTSTTDGLSWTNNITGGSALRAITYALGRFVVVGDGGRRLLSFDGETWEHETLGGPLLRGVAYGNGHFVAVGGDRSFVSSDGSTWEEHTTSGATFTGLAFGNDVFVATGERGHRYTSSDGVVFARRANDNGMNFVDIVFGQVN